MRHSTRLKDSFETILIIIFLLLRLIELFRIFPNMWLDISSHQEKDKIKLNAFNTQNFANWNWNTSCFKIKHSSSKHLITAILLCSGYTKCLHETITKITTTLLWLPQWLRSKYLARVSGWDLLRKCRSRNLLLYESVD